MTKEEIQIFETTDSLLLASKNMLLNIQEYVKKKDIDTEWSGMELDWLIENIQSYFEGNKE